MLLLALAVLLAVPNVVFADGDGPACSDHTLRGSYLFSATGFGPTPSGTPLQPKAIVESIVFNGDGTLTVTKATVSFAGQILTFPGGTGTYDLGEQCTGVLTFSNGLTFDIYADPNGDLVKMIQTNPGNVLQGNVSRVSR